MSKKLKDVVPREFFIEYMDAPAAKYLDKKVKATYHTHIEGQGWRGISNHKNVHVWWLLEGNIAVAWNENQSRGWSFPVVKNVKIRE